MNKTCFFYLLLLLLPSCTSFLGNKSKVFPAQSYQVIYKKAFLKINDIGCDDCFKLLQNLLMTIRGVSKVYLEWPNNDYQNNRLIIEYDSSFQLDCKMIQFILKEWNFDLEKIELC